MIGAFHKPIFNQSSRLDETHLFIHNLEEIMNNKTLSIFLCILFTLLVATPVLAITFGELDGDLHPNVGALVIVDENGVKDIVCSGTLISPTVFLTAAHYVDWMPAYDIDPGDVWVTFDSQFDQGSTIYPATYYFYPGAWHDMADPKDLAVLVLDNAITDITPASLPIEGLLDQMKNSGELKGQKFVTVGYGTVRDDKTKGFQTFYWDGSRRYGEQTFLALTKSWLKISMNPSTGNGGTCYGDSGGPHFLGNTDIVMSVTVTGDTPCRAMDTTYRVDTPVARAFLGQFVTLP
jgi:secreted trypsin-like serine protease